MAGRRCPICNKKVSDNDSHALHRPFCSKRCREVDLARWLTGSYAIPVVEEEDEDEGGVPSDEPPLRH